MRPAPVRRELVPPVAQVAPEGFAVLDAALDSGLPHRVALGPGLTLVVVLPTGVVAAWREAEPAALVSSSESESDPTVVAAQLLDPRLGAPPLRLVVEIGGATAACLPPVLGLRHYATAGGVGCELVPLAWRLHAGTVVRPGAFGSFVRVAWRSVSRGTERFAVPPGRYTQPDEEER